MAEQTGGEIELPLDGVGKRLQRAREQAGLTRAEVAARTRIAERHLAAIDEERFGDFASSTYAVGFSRAYARAVGLDEQEIAALVRAELAGAPEEPRTAGPTFEPGDPARVPPSRFAWLAGLAAIVVIGIVFVAWRSYFVPSVSLPDLTSDTPSAAPSPAAAPAPPSADPRGAVVFTAQSDRVWVKFTDAAGRQLMQREMKLGESYTVPADAQGPQIWTARPDALAITIGGRPVAPLADRQVSLRNVPVSAAALLARAPATSPTVPSPAPTIAPAAPAAVAPAPRVAPRPAANPPGAPRAAAPAGDPAPAAEVAPPAVAVPAAPENSTVSN